MTIIVAIKKSTTDAIMRFTPKAQVSVDGFEPEVSIDTIPSHHDCGYGSKLDTQACAVLDLSVVVLLRAGIEPTFRLSTFVDSNNDGH